MRRQITRRRFLVKTAGGGAGLLILNNSLSVRTYAANEKVNVALVGVGGRGQWFVDEMPKMQNVVALCDVDDRKIAATFGRWKENADRFTTSPNDWERRAAGQYKRLLETKPKTFSDFRRMLDEMGGGLDAVIVATPDHSHAVVSAAAIRAGKGVFCEKPLTRTLHESRALRELSRKFKVATSMGNQGTYSGPFRRALELIRNGTIGEIKEVHVWNSGGGADRKEPPKGEEQAPEGLNWDLWLGPAAMRPFNRQWMQRHNWREFGTCQLGNWASHTANLGFMSLKVHELWLAKSPKAPAPVIRVSAETSGINKLSFPRWEIVKWEIPARAEFPPITIAWYNGPTPGIRDMIQPLKSSIGNERERGLIDFAGTLIVGAKGKILTTGHNMSFWLLPEDQFKDVQRREPETVEKSRGPEQDWFAACRGGKTPWANFDYADALNEFLMLGNVATQFETALEFDPAAMKITNNKEADALLRAEYRTGWVL